MIKRIKWFQPIPEGPYVFDIKLYDIPETVYKGIMNAPDNCVAFSASKDNPRSSKDAIIRAAKEKNIRIFWSRKF